MKHYAGLDLSMETTHVCVVDADGHKIGAQCADSTPGAIATALEQYGPIERAVIETGRMTPSIALGLRELGVAIVCIDARQAHQSLKAIKANKTDPHDAAGLAQLARTGFYKEVHVKSPAAHGVRAVITARGHLVEARVRLNNTIRGLCATFGIRARHRPGRTLPRTNAGGGFHPGPRRSGRVAAPRPRAPGRGDRAAGSSTESDQPRLVGLPGLDEHPRRRCADLGRVRSSR